MPVPIHVEDVGPVTEFEYTMGDYGLHVLRGQQGAGKTTILRTVTMATNGKPDVKPTKRDGAKRGVAQVGDKTIKIARTVREEGELEVEGLGDLDIGVLHWPKFNDATTRDKYRIRTLVRLAGVQPDISMFYDLVGEASFWDIVDRSASEETDLVEMAAKVKRALDSAALQAEKTRNTAKAHAAAEREHAAGVDIKAEHDSDKLQTALENAIGHHADVHARAQSSAAAREAAQDAQERITALKQSYSGPTVEKAEKAVNKASEEAALAAQRLDDLHKAIDEAERAVDAGRAKVENAALTREMATQYVENIQALEKLADAATVEGPTDEELLAAADAVQDAKGAVETGVRVRTALSAVAKSKAYANEAYIFDNDAKRLRKAAKGTFERLSDAIGSIPNSEMRVWNDDNGNPRLVLQTERSEREPFDELSDGERWKVILPLCVGDSRLIILSQAAFGELQPKNRLLLDQLARDNKCYILTALADDGPLRGEAYASKTQGVLV